MTLEWIALSAGLVAAFLLMLRSERKLRRVSYAILALAVLAGVYRWYAHATISQPDAAYETAIADELPILSRAPEYVSSNQCIACHPGEHASWHRTYHRTMTQVASPETVMGEFDGRTVESNGLEYRVYEENGALWAEMPDPEEMMYVVQGGKPTPLEEIPRVKRQVVMTTGSHHYQTYWVDGADRFGRLQQTLPLVWLPGEKRWIPREAAFMLAPGTPRMIIQWNHACINCHSTAPNPGLDPSKSGGAFETEVAELGISCEACHGPGGEHVRAYSDPAVRYAAHAAGAKAAPMVNPETLDHRRSSQVCGQCHGVYRHKSETAMRFATQGLIYRPGDDVHQARDYIYFPTDKSPPEDWRAFRQNREFYRHVWWDDGTIIAAGREYTAMSVSGCYTRGEMSCLSCHSMHDSDPVDQLKPGMRGNQACTKCHTEPEYTSELTRHTFHDPGSSGSECMNCHMPHTSYALFKGIRSHQIESPSVKRSKGSGAPNACNLCHLDQTLAWTQKAMIEWYDHEPTDLSEEQETISAALLWLLKGHAAQRVIAAWHLGWEPAQKASGADWLAPFQARLLKDPYGVVRYVAERELRTLPGFESFRYDYLADPGEWQRHIDQIIAAWNDAKPETLPYEKRNILIDENGALMEAEIQRLLDERDNRPVTISE